MSSDDELSDNLSDTSVNGRKAPALADEAEQARRSEGEDDLEAEGDDLFGDAGSDDDAGVVRTLDDEELDSGDDDGRHDRRIMNDIDEEDVPLNIGDYVLSRVQIPESSDGEFYTLTMPDFLKIEAENFLPSTCYPQSFAAAAQSVYWRHDPQIKDRLQANSRILRWSDGSMTLQLASNPRGQYRLSAKPLSTPSMGSTNKTTYDPEKDAHTYLGAVLETAGLIRIESHVTTSLSVLPTTTETDDAILRLQESMAAATKNAKTDAEGKLRTIEVNEDPDLAKKRAELLERDKLRAQRKRQAAAEREMDRNRGRGLGTRSGGTGGLGMGGLEGDLEGSRPRPKKPKRQSNRRGEIFTDDEEDYDRRGRTREDEYDEDDGFLVGSDEESEVVNDDDDEEEELEDEEEEANERRSGRPRVPSPKRSRVEADDDEESADRTGNTPPQRKKNRYVVDDDDDDE